MARLSNSRSGLRRALVGAGAALAMTALSACGGGGGGSTAEGGLENGLGGRAENRDAYFFSLYDPASDAFWNQILQGAEDGAELTNQNLTAQTAEGDNTKMVNLIQSAIATDPAVMYIPFNDPSWNNAVCEAADAGIPVIAFNVGPEGGAEDCIRAFVGQDFFEVGTLVGERLLQEVDLKAGDKVLCPAEEPTQQYAIQRGGGVEAALKKAGVTCTYLRTSGADETALNALTTWLGANQDVKAIVPLGGTPHRNAVAAQEAAGSSAAIIGFDTSPQVIQGIKDGDIIATADQQGYVQGFQSVLQGGLLLDFGLSPATINSGGNSLVDQGNVELLEAEDLQGVRY